MPSGNGANAVLQSLGALLLSGGVVEVDCSGTPGPATLVLKLPPDFAKHPAAIKIHRIGDRDPD